MWPKAWNGAFDSTVASMALCGTPAAVRVNGNAQAPNAAAAVATDPGMAR
jgi:hypothetical protein